MGDLLGVAVLGAGHMGADHIRRLDRVVSGARVVAVADPDAERAKEAVAAIPGVSVHTEAEAALAANRRFRSVVRIGPVQVGIAYDGRGREKHIAV
ncbi:Gfo/Idh/MocA family oxidoreductase, partial [Streptomyces asoensis]|uniref:Gfo/Idh/MocA family oxidoreductase n=1 Tax=Streptomyces asoensis TaxID=249586 RepID=UPI0033DBD1A1